MINALNIKKDKQEILVELLNRTRDKRRTHHLYLVSCYFKEQSVTELIKLVDRSIKLSGVTVYVDRKSALLLSEKEVQKIFEQTKLGDLGVDYYAVDSDQLFHSKAYAVISCDQGNEIKSGSLVIGSANLTVSGLTRNGGNIECLLDTQNVNILDNFINQVNGLKKIKFDEVFKFRQQQKDDFNFKYALLNRGSFIHRWLGNIGHYFSIRYRLTKSGAERLVDKDILSMRFAVDAATISKQYFHLRNIPTHIVETDDIKKNFGIETLLGHWVPLVALEPLLKSRSFKKFQKDFSTQVQDHLSEIKKTIDEEYRKLLELKIIEERRVNPVVKFEEKINDLIENDHRLLRIFNRYEVFSLPYSIEDRVKIEELFEEIVEFCHSRSAQNVAMRGFLKSYESATLDAIDKEIVMFKNKAKRTVPKG